MSNLTAAIWIEENSAMVLTFDGSRRQFHETRYRYASFLADSGRTPPEGAQALYENVCDAMDDAAAIIVTGPARQKTDFQDFVARSRPDLGARIVGTQDLERFSEKRLVALACWHFSKPTPEDVALALLAIPARFDAGRDARVAMPPR